MEGDFKAKKKKNIAEKHMVTHCYTWFSQDSDGESNSLCNTW